MKNNTIYNSGNRRKSQGEQRNVRKANQGVTNNCHVRNEERHPNPRRYSSQSGNRALSGFQPYTGTIERHQFNDLLRNFQSRKF